MGCLVKNSTLVQNLSVLSFGSHKMQNISNIFRSRVSWFWPCKQHGIGGRNITSSRPEAYRQTDRKEYYKKKMILNKCNSDGLETIPAMNAHSEHTKGKELSQLKANQAVETQPNHKEGKELSPSKTNRATDTHLKHTEENELSQQATVLVFDIETTGFKKEDRIIEFAAQDLAGGNYSTFQSLVNPGCIIQNARVHGISTQMVNKPDVPRWKDLAPILVQYVRSRQKAGRPVIWVSHNCWTFDSRFIMREFDRCSVQIPSDWFFVDTLPLAREVMNLSGSKRTAINLDALRRYYEIPVVGSAHRAMSDVNTLALVLQKISFELKLTVPGLLEKAFQISDLTLNSNSSKR